MGNYRLRQHPILEIPQIHPVAFYWQNRCLEAQEGETIAAALFANGIRIFGHHPHDGSPQGLFCANGQCAQCLVLADNQPVKACMNMIRAGMRLQPMEGLPDLSADDETPSFRPIREITVEFLILGGGPAGISAGIELGNRGIHGILVDDKNQLGGKLVLQTHRFFGSRKLVFAGSRGIEIARRLGENLEKLPSVSIWLESTALAVFSDQAVGILRPDEYVLVRPKLLIAATGAREKFLTFQGNTLPGVYGAGAFQTLVNRDQVLPGERIFIVGGGNVGLIAGYHALQAGIEVAGVCEAMPTTSGYKVHRDKLARLGVPIFTSHTILAAHGQNKVEGVAIAKIDEAYRTIPGSEKFISCDSVLIAIGLDPVNEFRMKAEDFGLPVLAAGDADEIAEASAAMISGKIAGMKAAKILRHTDEDIPTDWYQTRDILKSRPGRNILETPYHLKNGIYPVIHCTQEIPCDPCASLCPKNLIYLDGPDIRAVPRVRDNDKRCAGCYRCLVGCPGLAITLVDTRVGGDTARVSLPYECSREWVEPGSRIMLEDTQGNDLIPAQIVRVFSIRGGEHTSIVQVEVPRDIAVRVTGLRIQTRLPEMDLPKEFTPTPDSGYICRCERVTTGEIRALIRQGVRDLNEIKTLTRAGMGACGAKTCSGSILQLFRQEGVPITRVTAQSSRPLFIEVPLGYFAGTTVHGKLNDSTKI